MTHPLTDEIIDELAQFNPDLTGKQVINRDHDMRAAADWQLEKVAEWIGENGLRGYVSTDSFTIIHTQEAIADLKKAMRPQEES